MDTIECLRVLLVLFVIVVAIGVGAYSAEKIQNYIRQQSAIRFNTAVRQARKAEKARKAELTRLTEQMEIGNPMYKMLDGRNASRKQFRFYSTPE